MLNLSCCGPGESIDTHIVGFYKKVEKIWISRQIWKGTPGPSGGSESAQKCPILIVGIQGSPKRAKKILPFWGRYQWILHGSVVYFLHKSVGFFSLFLLNSMHFKLKGANIIGFLEKVLKIWISRQIWKGTPEPSGGSESAQKCW